MDDSEFLSRDDVRRLTGRRRKKEQIAHLLSRGIKFEVNAAGEPVVLKEWLDGKPARKSTREFVPAALRG